MHQLKPFVTIISNAERFSSDEYNEILGFLKSKGWIPESVLSNIDWDAPSEYVQESGVDLETRIVVFKDFVSDKDLVNLKQLVSELECKYSVDQQRKFNINPGFLSMSGMYLLSHKPNTNRKRQIFGPYFVEKQYDVIEHVLVPNSNTFSEYLGDRIVHLNMIYQEIFSD